MKIFREASIKQYLVGNYAMFGSDFVMFKIIFCHVQIISELAFVLELKLHLRV